MNYSYFREDYDARKFVCAWSDGYNENADIVSFQFFTEDVGYERNDIERINKMKPFQIINLTDMSGFHIVVRIA